MQTHNRELMMSSRTSRSSRSSTRPWSILVLGIGAFLTAGCAHGRSARSYLPVGAGAQYGADTNDGVTWTLPRPVDQAVDSIVTVLQAEGFRIDQASVSTRELRTSPRALGADTTLVVRAQFLAVALPSPGTVIVLTATYNVPSRQIQNAPVIQRANSTNTLYARLLAVAAAARGSAVKR